MSANDASRIVSDESVVILHIVASLTNDSRDIICNRDMFIVQAADNSGW